VLSDSVATEPSLVQRYADLRGQAGGITESVRGMRFNALLADVLIRDGIDAEADRRGPHGEVDVAFSHDGSWYLLEAKWYADPITDEPLRRLRDMLTERRPGTIGILGSWSGFTDSARRRAESAHDVILFDRPHLEALISGAASGPELIAAANRSISVFGHSETPLSVLLRPRRAAPTPSRCGSAPRTASPRPPWPHPTASTPLSWPTARPSPASRPTVTGCW
jgi:hypothetical protein